MNTAMQGGMQLERELTPEPVFGPAAGSLLLHGALAGSIVFYAVFAGLFHHNTWGGSGGGAIQVKLVSDALPLPADQKPNDNVLSTETPSPAPAVPAPKTQQKVDTTAIPIQGKQAKPKPQAMQKTQAHQPQPKQDNRVQYGEQSGSSMPRSTSPATSSGPTSVSDGDFGNRFPWYVDGINRKMAFAWDKREVDSRTPRGARVYLIFTIHRDGTPAEVQLDRSSGSPTLDRSCVRGVQRVDTFGQLPALYNQSTLKVSYYCEY
jgi:protein TonB